MGEGGLEEGQVALDVGAEEVRVVVGCAGDVDQGGCDVDDLLGGLVRCLEGGEMRREGDLRGRSCLI